MLYHITHLKAIELYVENGVYTEEEMIARANVHVETYGAKISIEARTMLDMARRQIMPAVSAYAGELSVRLARLKEA